MYLTYLTLLDLILFPLLSKIKVYLEQTKLLLEIGISPFSTHFTINRPKVAFGTNSKKPGLRCMSFVPTPLQASAASASNDASKVNSASTADAAAAADASNPSDMDLVFKNRTFDQYWVDKASLMYKDGIAKVSLYAMFSVCFCG